MDVVLQKFIDSGKPSQNGHVKSFNRTFLEDCPNEHWFRDMRVRREVEALAALPTTPSDRTTRSAI